MSECLIYDAGSLRIRCLNRFGASKVHNKKRSFIKLLQGLTYFSVSLLQLLQTISPSQLCIFRSVLGRCPGHFAAVDLRKLDKSLFDGQIMSDGNLLPLLTLC